MNKQSSPIKGILFDMDGLMIDSERLYFEVERDMARSFGKQVKDETLWKMMGRTAPSSLQVFVDDLGLDISAQEAVGIRQSKMEEKLRSDLQAMPGLMDALNGLHGEFLLAVATGSPRHFLNIVLESLQIQKYFHTTVTADEVTEGKPHPEIFLKAAAQLGLEPQNCVVLEDSSNGALAGKRAGSCVVAIPTVYTEKQDFSFVDAQVKDLWQATAYIQSIKRAGS